MTSDVWTANGLDLQPATEWCWIEDYSPMIVGPGKRGSNVTLPGRHGEATTRGKRYAAAELTVPIWVLGIDRDTGRVAADDARQLHENIGVLRRVFAAESVRLTHSWGGQGARVAVVEPAPDPPPITRHRSSPAAARVDFPVRLPAAFWADEDAQVQEIEGPTGTIVELDAFAGANAPMTDLQVVFQGPVSNPLLIHGHRTLQWNGVIPAGRQLVLATGPWQISPGTGTNWTPDVRQVTWFPGPGWLELDPASVDPFAVEFHHTGGGSARCWITARRKYLNP